MEFDEEKLSKDIDNLTGICKEGREDIKKLFTNHFDVTFKKSIVIDRDAIGNVFSGDYGEYVLLNIHSNEVKGDAGGYILRNVRCLFSYPSTELKGPKIGKEMGDQLMKDGYTLVSKSLKEHYTKKSKMGE